jgi:hypothetical protein
MVLTRAYPIAVICSLLVSFGLDHKITPSHNSIVNPVDTIVLSHVTDLVRQAQRCCKRRSLLNTRQFFAIPRTWGALA